MSTLSVGDIHSLVTVCLRDSLDPLRVEILACSVEVTSITGRGLSRVSIEVAERSTVCSRSFVLKEELSPRT